jgi:hypothetical protein
VVGRLGQRFWARGIGTAALRQFLQREQIRPLFADPFIANTASVRLLQRCGFRRVGTDREGDLEFAVLMLADSAQPAADTSVDAEDPVGGDMSGVGLEGLQCRVCAHLFAQLLVCPLEVTVAHGVEVGRHGGVTPSRRTGSSTANLRS